jgi:hypothetical protein
VNLIDAYVTEVHGNPYESYGKWWVKVTSDCYGRPTEGALQFDTRDEALAVKPGFHHLT